MRSTVFPLIEPPPPPPHTQIVAGRRTLRNNRTPGGSIRGNSVIIVGAFFHCQRGVTCCRRRKNTAEICSMSFFKNTVEICQKNPPSKQQFSADLNRVPVAGPGRGFRDGREKRHSGSHSLIVLGIDMITGYCFYKKKQNMPLYSLNKYSFKSKSVIEQVTSATETCIQSISLIPNSVIYRTENSSPAHKQLTVCFVQSGIRIYRRFLIYRTLNLSPTQRQSGIRAIDCTGSNHIISRCLHSFFLPITFSNISARSITDITV